MRDESEKQRLTQRAFRTFGADVSVYLVYGKHGGVASGVVFKSNSGRPVVLTARHVAEDLGGGFSIGCSNQKEAEPVAPQKK